MEISLILFLPQLLTQHVPCEGLKSFLPPVHPCFRTGWCDISFLVGLIIVLLRHCIIVSFAGFYSAGRVNLLVLEFEIHFQRGTHAADMADLDGMRLSECGIFSSGKACIIVVIPTILQPIFSLLPDWFQQVIVWAKPKASSVMTFTLSGNQTPLS